MRVSTKNNVLNKAKSVKNDEFYTILPDIEHEMGAYIGKNPDVFRGKTILCPCDDPEWSNFPKHFIEKRHVYGFKKLISTCYVKGGRGKKLVLENGVGNITLLNGDGDFRGSEVTDLLGGVDLIITNPPFSLFREFIAWIMKYDKKFSIIGNPNAITYKEVFPLIKENKIWLGSTSMSGNKLFSVPNPEEYIVGRKKGRGYGVYDGKIYAHVKACWFTNIEHDRRHEIQELSTIEQLKDRGIEFPKYDNYDAIKVFRGEYIPKDYDGIMGVPVTWLDKYNPDQFEILGVANHGNDNEYDLFAPTVGGNEVYKRLLIKNKRP